MAIAYGILALLTIVCVILCAQFLQQIRDELREMNGNGKAKNPSRANHYGTR